MQQNVAMVYLYEVRGSDVYPTVDNTSDDYGLPAFEISGTDVYPTVHNNRHDYGLPAFEIRGTYAYPTVHNNHDDYGLPAFEVSQDEYEDISLPVVVYAAAAGAGFFAAMKAYPHVRNWWQEKAKRKTDGREALAASPAVTAPPGWYLLNGEQRYWDGLIWTESRAPAGFPAYQPYFHAPVVLKAPKNGAVVATAWTCAFLTAGYMLPWAIAVTRGKSDSGKVGLVNFLLGWTIIGWVVALVRACNAHPVAYVQHRS